MTQIQDFQHTDDLNESLTEGLWLHITSDESVMEVMQNGECIVSTFISDFCVENNLNFNADKCLVYDMFCQEAIDQWM